MSKVASKHLGRKKLASLWGLVGIASLVGIVGMTTPLYQAKAAEVAKGDVLAKDQTFTYRLLDEISSFDPHIVEDYDGSRVVSDLFEGLFQQNAKGDTIPALALSYQVSADKLTYTFELRKDGKWSDGKPVTAGDFVYGWQRAADPKNASPYAGFIELMAVDNAKDVIAGTKPLSELGIKAEGDYKLVVKLSKAIPFFIQMLSQTTTFPAPKWAIDKYGKEWTKPENIVVNGAYKLTEHVPKERSVRVRNPLYRDNQKTVIEKVVALVIPDENQALTRYKAGELTMTDVPAGQLPDLKKSMPAEIATVPQLCNYYYTFNLSPKGPEAFKDVRVRQAMSYALDRDVIINQVLKGDQYPAYFFTPEATSGFVGPKLAYASLKQSERDAKAKELMKAAGYGPGGKKLAINLLYNTSEAHKAVAVVASQMWKQKLGIEITLNNQEWKVFLENRGAQNFELARGAWCGDYNEASTFLDIPTTNSGYNDGKYSNAKFDELVDKAKTADKPAPLYQEAEEILAKDVPFVPVYHYTKSYVMRSQLKGWPYKNIQQHWVSKDLYLVENK